MRLPNLRISIITAGVVVFAAAASLPAVAATAKLGGTCTKAQSGKTSGTLLCAKSGSTYKWVKKPATKTTTKATTKSTTASASAAEAVSNSIDVAAIAFGTIPATAASKLDISCNGLSGSETQAINTVNFGAQGGTNRMTFALVAPSSSNPTGSTCTASATATGAANMRFLVNGLPDGTTTPGSTATSRSFTGANAVVTLLIEYPGGTAAASTGTTTPGAAALAPTTTVAGAATATPTTLFGSAATTTTIGPVLPPPASGRAELQTRFPTAVPPTMTGIDFTINCTPATSPGAFQTQTTRLGVVPATAQLNLTFVPATVAAAATACQIESRLLGTEVGGASLRFLLNGQPMSGATTGSFINSPTFSAPQAFTIALEVTFPGFANGVSTNTVPTAGATLPTIPQPGTQPVTGVSGGATTNNANTPAAGNQAIVTLALTRTGNAPANLDGYYLDLACTGVLVGTNPSGAFSFRSRILPAGGTTSVPVTVNTASKCTVTVTSVATSGTVGAGNISITNGGTPVANGAGGSAATSPFTVVAGTQNIGITVAY